MKKILRRKNLFDFFRKFTWGDYEGMRQTVTLIVVHLWTLKMWKCESWNKDLIHKYQDEHSMKEAGDFSSTVSDEIKKLKSWQRDSKMYEVYLHFLWFHVLPQIKILFVQIFQISAAINVHWSKPIFIFTDLSMRLENWKLQQI